MLPITRATLQSFCRVCLRELPTAVSNKEPNHAINNTSALLQSITGVRMDNNKLSLFPRQMCHSCYIKTNALKSFREKCIIATGVLKMLATDITQNESLKKLQTFCRVCLKKRNSTMEQFYTMENHTEIYEHMEECAGLRLRIEATTNSIDALSNDVRFPQHLCGKCYATLKSFKEFRAIAKQTDEYLQSLLDGVEDQPFEPIEQLDFKAEIIESTSYNVQDTNQAEHEILIEQLPICAELVDNVCSEDSNGFDSDVPLQMPLEVKTEPFETEVVDNDAKITDFLDTCEAFDVIAATNDSPTSQRHYRSANSISTAEDCLLENHSSPENTENSDSDISEAYTAPSKRRYKKKQQLTTPIKKEKTTIKCLQCNKSFYKSYIYEAHVKGVHEGVDKPFACPYCTSCFRLVQVLNRHIHDKHTQPQLDTTTTSNDIFTPTTGTNRHVCLYCQRLFKRKDHLKEHIRAVHEGLRPFKCKICNKSFGSKNTQLRHEQNHSEERPYACEYCTKRYNSEAELKVHIQRHTTNPNLLCPICKRGKPNVEELQKHIAMHEASRQHQCPKCGKVFTKLFHLREHDSTVHLKLRPFKCSYCEQTFGVRKTLRTHERSHDPTGRPELCTICQLYFQTKRALLLHTKRIHSRDENVPTLLAENPVVVKEECLLTASLALNLL